MLEHILAAKVCALWRNMLWSVFELTPAMSRGLASRRPNYKNRKPGPAFNDDKAF
jgi:hypothetical protein